MTKRPTKIVLFDSSDSCRDAPNEWHSYERKKNDNLFLVLILNFERNILGFKFQLNTHFNKLNGTDHVKYCDELIRNLCSLSWIMKYECCGIQYRSTSMRQTIDWFSFNNISNGLCQKYLKSNLINQWNFFADKRNPKNFIWIEAPPSGASDKQ